MNSVGLWEEEERVFLEEGLLEMDFKGQEVHLNPDSYAPSMGCQVRKQEVLDK